MGRNCRLVDEGGIRILRRMFESVLSLIVLGVGWLWERGRTESSHSRTDPKQNKRQSVNGKGFVIQSLHCHCYCCSLLSLSHAPLAELLGGSK
jgi:hypothetical protein